MLLGRLLFFVVLICGGLTTNLTYTCDSNPYVNGCTIPTSMRNYRRTYTFACNKHDICYSCGSERGISRRSCDIMFREMVEERCMLSRRRISRRRKLCRLLTFLSYTAVRLRGREGYSQISPLWCGETWVSPCLDQ